MQIQVICGNLCMQVLIKRDQHRWELVPMDSISEGGDGEGSVSSWMFHTSWTCHLCGNLKNAYVHSKPLCPFISSEPQTLCYYKNVNPRQLTVIATLTELPRFCYLLLSLNILSEIWYQWCSNESPFPSMKYFYIQHHRFILLRLPPVLCLLTASVTNTVNFLERIITDMVIRLHFWSFLIVCWFVLRSGNSQGTSFRYQCCCVQICFWVCMGKLCLHSPDRHWNQLLVLER